jgi:TRAP-type mannitol/chloroaromatic compound transport system permease large subunit
MQNSRRKFVTGSVAGAILVTVFARRFNFAILRNVVRDTTKITAMMMFILMAAQVFALSFRGLQGEALIEDMFGWLSDGENTAV